MTLFAFIDIETTGLTPGEDHILEIGWIITDETFKQRLPGRSFIVEHSQENWQSVWSLLKANDYVRNMHEKSGLANDLLNAAAHSMDAIAVSFVRDIQTSRDDDEPVHLAGFSVGFDRSFLMAEESFSDLFEEGPSWYGFKIHHRLLDLSSIKLMYQSAGLTLPTAPNDNPHRALSDVRESLWMARRFRSDIGNLGSKKAWTDGRTGMADAQGQGMTARERAALPQEARSEASPPLQRRQAG